MMYYCHSGRHRSVVSALILFAVVLPGEGYQVAESMLVARNKKKWKCTSCRVKPGSWHCCARCEGRFFPSCVHVCWHLCVTRSVVVPVADVQTVRLKEARGVTMPTWVYSYEARKDYRVRCQHLRAAIALVG